MHLLNLLKNSVAAMERTGRPGRLSVSTRSNPETVLLSVADTGEGIPAENLTKIFEPFFTTRDMGTGLGLSIVHRIFTEHGGALVLHSKVGEGTDFRVEFHLKTPTPPLLPSPHPETPHAPGH
jgi:signal transduction histidine kinase